MVFQQPGFLLIRRSLVRAQVEEPKNPKHAQDLEKSESFLVYSTTKVSSPVNRPGNIANLVSSQHLQLFTGWYE